MSKRDEYEAVYGSEGYPEDGEELENTGVSIFDADYSDVYDEEEGAVYCPNCGAEMKFRDADSTYCCPECDSDFEREWFFNYIGAEPKGPECLTCSNLYPGCTICPYGYVNEDKF